jgi:hypothetical protein
MGGPSRPALRRELERLVREGTVSMQTAVLYASNSGDLRVQLADVSMEE